MVSRSAAHQVFQTVELLEQILLNLQVDDLLPLHLTCTHWQEVMASSIAIQRSLFFSLPSRGPIDPDILLAIRTKQTSTTMTLETETKQTPAATIDFEVNTLLTKQFCCWSVHWDEDIKMTLLHEDHPTRKRLGKTSSVGPDIPCMHLEEPCFLRPEASWQKMFITQPPHRWIGVRAWNSVIIRVENENGVTMGDVADCMRWYWGCNKSQRGGNRTLRPRLTMMHDPVSRGDQPLYRLAAGGWTFSSGRLSWDKSLFYKAVREVGFLISD
ncbi:MAG: hypothetical protein Q9187_001097 [Circinaria calcarea]